jgi:hypothetical protein
MSEYKERDIEQLDLDGDYYMRHISAMTVEGLHDKMEIAGELAYRDFTIDALRTENKELKRKLFNEGVKNNSDRARVEFLEEKLKEMEGTKT